MSRLRRRPSAATLIALVALFVSLGGSSYAALTITGKNVKDGSLTGKDVKNNSLDGKDVKNITNGDVKDRSLIGTDLKQDSVGGTAINESTLGKVPSAASADNATTAANANTVGGRTPAQLRTTAAFGQNSAVLNDITTGGTDVATTTITTAATGRILATGSAELTGASSGEVGQCRIRLDGTSISLVYEAEPDDIGDDNQFVIALNGSKVDVPAGTYTVALRCNSVGAGTVGKDDAAISVQGIPNP